VAESRPNALPAHIEDIGTVKPFITYVCGLGLSTLAGTIAGTCMLLFWNWVNNGPSPWWYVPFLGASIIVGFAMYGQGMDSTVPVGFYGVLTIFGRRTTTILSEGSHWLFPGFMGYIPVDHKTQMSEEIIVSNLSADNIRLTGKFVYRFQITRPLVWLGAQKERYALDEIGKTCFRDEFTRGQSDKLIHEETKGGIARRIDKAMSAVARSRYGIDILNVMVPEVSMPPEYEAALQKKRIEEAKREAEKVDTDAFMARVDEFIEKGLAPELAVENMQVQRGTVKAERKIIRIEGVQNLVDSLGSTITSAVKTIAERNTK
jgi:hypothetical protein